MVIKLVMGEFCSFDILVFLMFQVLPQTRLTFYGPKALNIHMVPTDKADEFYQVILSCILG